MQKDPYLTLGIPHEADLETIERAYRSLKDRYGRERFNEGESGAIAARMLGEIDEAYAECTENYQRNQRDRTAGGFGDIEDMIRSGKLEDAQTVLDDMEVRSAQWHYYQAIIYHKRNWNVESKKQLEIALTLDVGNEKYQNALDKLNKLMSGEELKAASNGSTTMGADGQIRQDRAGYSQPDRDQMSGADTGLACCNTCTTLLCCDMCCECFGGDCIPCC